MREASISADDIAVQAAKAKLADLPQRPGYREATKPQVKPSRTAQLVMLALSILFGALTAVCFSEIDSTALRWLLGLVFGALTLFCLLATLGSAPEKPPVPLAAAVLAKSHDRRQSDDQVVHHRVLLLVRDSGEQRQVYVLEATLYDALRTGDVGVAHVRTHADAAGHDFLIGFVRL